MKKNAQRVNYPHNWTIGIMINRELGGQPSIFTPRPEKVFLPFLRAAFKLDRDEAKKRISTVGGYHYIPSRGWRERANKLFTGRTY